MTYPHWLLDILRDPATGKKIVQDFANKDGILSLVYPPDLSGENLKMNAFYDRIAPFYHFFESFMGWLLTGIRMKQERRKILALLGLQKGSRLLEVSPGPGVFQPLLRQALGPNAEIVSVDLSIRMLQQCKKHYKGLNIQLIQANAEHLPFADESFDALFHFGGINLFNDPNKALNEFVRVVRKGGLVCWGDEKMSKNFRHPVGRWLLPRLNPGYLKEQPPIPNHLENIRQYEVYKGLGYLIIGNKKV